MSDEPPLETASPTTLVRLTEDAIADLDRLNRKDPQIVRWAFKKMLLLERGAHAGEPLLGGLIGFRKLVVGDRDWRIVWRVNSDQLGGRHIDIAEVWAAGARSDSEVYTEMQRRVERLGSSPKAIALAEVLTSMGRIFSDIEVTPEPQAQEQVPPWLAERLMTQIGLTKEEVAAMTPEKAMVRMESHWSKPPQNDT